MTCWRECEATPPRMTGNGRLNAGANSPVSSRRLDAGPSVPGAAHGVHELTTRQEVINFGFARLVQEGDQHFTYPAVGFPLGCSRYADRTGP
jgi:hypothetical protein